MTILAKIIADSINQYGNRITSVQLRYPKFIHGEVMTHRVFSRNAASSRAIPVERMIADVLDDPAMPVYWGKNQKGMQADTEFDYDTQKELRSVWLAGRDIAVSTVRNLLAIGVHKQIANRILEPWFNITTLVTATEWDNFFELRLHKDAQPEIQELARKIKAAMAQSAPVELGRDEWHLPYVDEKEAFALRGTEKLALKLSVARCARVSYLTQDQKKPTVESDLALYERLVGSTPLHASPAEHQASPDYQLDIMGIKEWQNEKEWNNFRGWRQYRAQLS